MDAKELDLLSVCKGALPEMFRHELQKVLNNMADPNTSATATRKIQFEITFRPFADRSGASTTLTSCKAVLASLDASGATGTIFLAKRDGKLCAFSRDLRQEMLFDEELATAPDGKSAGAGDGKLDGVAR